MYQPRRSHPGYRVQVGSAKEFLRLSKQQVNFNFQCTCKNLDCIKGRIRASPLDSTHV